MVVDLARGLLFVAGAFTGQAYVYDTSTGETVASYQFGAPGEALVNDVPHVDGIVLEAGRLWAVQSFSNQIVRIRLSADLMSGVVEETVTDDLFQVPTTAARFGNRLAVVNAKFDTGLPPTAEQYEVILVGR